MFGYVLPRTDKLSEEGKKRYRAAYCGLCRCLKEHYGFRCRFLVNYDMTFLYFLLRRDALEPPEKCFCPARVFCKKDCLPPDEAMDFAADVSVLLAYQKLRDAVHDGGFFRRIAARAGLLLYRQADRRAARRQPETAVFFTRQLELLWALEDENCPSIDRTADAFARLLEGCVSPQTPPAEGRAMKLLLYHVGRYLYLADALEDLPKDCRADRYNPLRFRYALRDGALTQEDKKEYLDTVEASIGMAASALELLPMQADRAEILRNIVYFGLPSVLHSVAAGTFRKRSKE